MKKIFLVICSLLSLNAMANPDVIGALILGGIVGHVIGGDQERHRQQVVIQPQVVPYPVPSYIVPGTPHHYLVPRTPVYRPITIWNPSCQCYQQYWEQVN